MEKIITTSKAILGIWNTLLDSGRKDFIDEMNRKLDMVKNISLEFDLEDLYPSEEHSIQSLTSIIDKILGRGNPTLVNKFFEDRLIKKIENKGFEFENLKDTTNGRKIGYRVRKVPSDYQHDEIIKRLNSIIYLKFNDQLTQHQLANNLETDDEKLVSSHEIDFYNMIGDKISPALQSHFLRQPLLTDLIGLKIDSIIGSKSDFAINFGSDKLVIEIDGEEHETDPAIEEHDQIRDEVLRENGWEVWRIKNEEVANGASESIAKLKHICDSSSIDLNGTLMTTNAFESYEFLLMLYPHLVHGTCKAINLILNYGHFPTKENAKILLVEEDIPTVIESLFEIYELSSKLCSLSGDFFQLPKVKIDYVGLGPIIKIPKNGYFSIRKVKKPIGKYDLIINHSYTLRSGQKGLLEEKFNNVKSVNRVRIRSFPSIAEERQMLWSNSIIYDLSDLESALVSKEDNLLIPDEKYQALIFLLQSIFRKHAFWEGQARAITRLLQRLSTIVLLPTGGGKSLIYQFAGLLHPGVTLIIDPLVALITDQVEHMNDMGFDRAGYISSTLEADERKQELSKIAKGEYYYVFVAPERLQMEDFRSALRTLISRYPISLAVIDEAHCVSEWGHDFRPSYLHLGLNIERYCSNDQVDPPPIVGLTGTASYSVLTDIQTELNIFSQDAIIEPTTFERKEIKFHVYTVEAREKKSQIKIIKDQMPRDFKKNPQSFYELRGEKTNCGIVFCLHAGKHSSLGAPKVANLLGHDHYFTGKIEKDQKIFLQKGFKNNKIQELVATKSFGMGIDKSNIVYTIHYTIPNSIEAFYQEAGRAGRTGKENSSHCYVIYSDDNMKLINDVIFNKDHQVAMKKLDSVGWDDRGDIFHHLWLLYNTYSDRSEEKNIVFKLWQTKLYPQVSNLPIGGTNSVKISFGKGDNNRGLIEKSIFRLVLLGVVTDYDIDWQHRNFNVRVINVSPEVILEALRKYFNKYKFKEYAEDMVKQINLENISTTISEAINSCIDFVYDEIVTKRKQALITMANICKDFRDHDHFSESILNYLQESEFTPILREWINMPFNEIGMDSINDVLQSVENHEQSRKLVGTTRRMLDEDPENIAIRLLLLITRTRSKLEVESSENIKNEMKSFIAYCIKHREKINVDQILLMVIEEIAKHGARTDLLHQTVEEALLKWGTRDLVRNVLNKYNDHLTKKLFTDLLNVLLASDVKSIKNLNFLKNI